MMVIAQQMQDLIDNCLQFHADYLQEREAGISFVNRDLPVSEPRSPRDPSAVGPLYDRHDHAENVA